MTTAATNYKNTGSKWSNLKSKLSEKYELSEVIQKGVLIFILVWFFIVLLMPLGQLFTKVLLDKDGNYVGLANFAKYFSSPALITSLWNTVYISVLSTVISVTLAFFFAYALCRSDMKFKKVFRYIAMLPLFAPTMMHGIGLIYLFGNKGLFTLIGIKVNLYGSLGIIISEIVYTFPQVYMIMLVAFEMTDFRLYEAAETLGAGTLKKFFVITLPSVKYGLISACAVSFTLSFTDFGAPKVVGGNYNVLATDIYKQVVGQQNMVMGAVVGILLTAPAVISFIIDRITQKRQSSFVSSRSVPYRIKPDKARDAGFTLLCSLISLCVIVLMLSVLIAAIVKIWPYDLTPTLKHFSFGNVAGYGLKPYYNSLLVSALSAVAGTAMVFINAYMIEKTRYYRSLRQAAYFLSILPLALPGLVIGLSYIMFFNKPYIDIPFLGISIVNVFNAVYGTIFILILANMTHFYSVPFITATTALKKLDREFESVAESMSIPFYKTFVKVSLPISLPAILEIGMYFFVNSMVTISAVVFLYSPQLKLASVAIANMEDAGDIAPAAAMSVLIVVTNIVVRLLYELVTKKIRDHSTRWQRREEL